RRLAGAVLLFLLLTPAPVRAEAPAPRVLTLLVPFAGPAEVPDPLVGEGLMDLLAWGIGRTFAFQLTEARAVVGALEARQAAWGAPVPPAAAVEVVRHGGTVFSESGCSFPSPGRRLTASSRNRVSWWPASERRLTQAFQRSTPTAAALRRYATGRAALRAGTTEGLEQAADAFAQAGEIDPAFALAFFRQGEAHEAASSRWRAAGAYRRAIHVDPAFAEAYKSLGDLLAKSPRRLYEQAVEAYGKAVEADPDYADAYVGLGDALSATGRFDEAIREYRRGLTIDPLNPRVHYSLARILYTEKGLYHEAVEAYQRALALEPTFVEAHIGLGDLYEEKGLYKEAIATYRKALVLKPKHPGALYALALAYEKVSPKEAVVRWEEYIRVASELPGEKEWIDIAEQHLKKMRQKAAEQEKRR
ncbi:MAG: tetratricopeptide repeat protein, partial [candidate division NC10 bacterium]|nr:tetratricopeptide repeat protein [candidate division NC10 bacterium]